MFAEARTELRWLIRDGIDAAVEFATLGEYRLPDDRPGSVVTVDTHAAADVPGRGRGECWRELGAITPRRCRERSARV